MLATVDHRNDPVPCPKCQGETIKTECPFPTIGTFLQWDSI